MFGSSQGTWFKWIHRQDSFFILIYYFFAISVLVSTSGGTSWNHPRFWRTWLVWKACPNPGLKTMAHHSSLTAESTRWLNSVNCVSLYLSISLYWSLIGSWLVWQLLDAMLNVFTCVFTLYFILILLNLQYVLTSREQHGNPPALGSSQGTTLSTCASKSGTCPWTRWDPDALQHLSA